MRPVSLYVHVPFCRRRCPYCTFYHVCDDDHRLEEAFVPAVVREFDIGAAGLGGSFCIPTIYLGGGTPSVLSRRSLESIFAAVSRRVDPAEAEVTIEINPEDVDNELMDTLDALPITRVSVGVQSMSRSGQRTLGRCGPAINERALASVKRVFTNFNVDLLLGIPGENPGALTDTLDRVLDTAPPHLSVYCLEPGGVLEAQAGSFFDRVDQERAADEYLVVCERLRECGYHHYEVSNFAIPGFESRHNQVYWQGGEYLGIGPGAHSYIAEERFFNVASIDAYIDGGDAFPGTVRRHDRRDPDERRLEEIMLALRTSAGFPVAGLPAGSSASSDLVREGLAAIRQGRLILSDRGFLVLNEIVRRLSVG